MAELVDAADSKSAVRKNVLVRFQSWAPTPDFMSGVLLTGNFVYAPYPADPGKYETNQSADPDEGCLKSLPLPGQMEEIHSQKIGWQQRPRTRPEAAFLLFSCSRILLCAPPAKGIPSPLQQEYLNRGLLQGNRKQQR